MAKSDDMKDPWDQIYYDAIPKIMAKKTWVEGRISLHFIVGARGAQVEVCSYQNFTQKSLNNQALLLSN